MMSAQLIPAILEQDESAILAKIRLLGSVVPLIHIDIADGKFVATITAPVHHLSSVAMKLPPAVTLEAHLMVDHPENYFELLDPAIWSSIIFHAEAIGFDEPELIIQHADEARKKFKSVGVAINPNTDPDLVPSVCTIENDSPFIQIMGIQPGKSGQEMLAGTPERLGLARTRCGQVSIDGGVTRSNLAALVHAGANRVVSASMIWSGADPLATIKEVQAELEQASA